MNPPFGTSRLLFVLVIGGAAILGVRDARGGESQYWLRVSQAFGRRADAIARRIEIQKVYHDRSMQMRSANAEAQAIEQRRHRRVLLAMLADWEEARANQKWAYSIYQQKRAEELARDIRH